MMRLATDPSGKTVRAMFDSLTLPGVVFVFTDDTFMMLRAVQDRFQDIGVEVEQDLTRFYDVSWEECVKHGVCSQQEYDDYKAVQEARDRATLLRGGVGR